MRIELSEVTWLEEHELSFAELCEVSGLTPELLEELVQAGAIPPLDIRPLELPARASRFGATALSAARHARRLREDFELDIPALLLVLGLFDRLHDLEQQLRTLQAHLPRRLPG